MKSRMTTTCRLAAGAMIFALALLTGVHAEAADAYFGLKPPTDAPEIFALGIVSCAGDRLRECSISFWPDGLRCFFARFGDSILDHTVFESHWTTEGWTLPAPSSLFPGAACEPSLSSDGQRIFYAPPNAPAGHGSHVLHMMGRDANGWSAPRPLFAGLYASADLEGTLYYTTYHRNKDHIACRLPNGEGYGEERLVQANVYDRRHEDAHPCVAPDGSYLIFDSSRRPRSGTCPLYVTFRSEDATWTEPVNMEPVLGDRPAGLARLSPDGRALFFNANGGIYWIDASVVERLR